MFLNRKLARKLFFLAISLLFNTELSAQYLLSIDSLKAELLLNHPDTVKVKVLFEIGREQWFKRNFHEASLYLDQSVELSEKLGYFKLQADACNLLANVRMKQESFDLALTYLEKGIKLNDEQFMPSLYETYSKLYYQLGDYQSALQYALQAAELFEKDSNPLFNLQAVFSYLMIGDILTKLGRDDSAFEYYHKAYKKGLTAEKNWYIKTPIQRIAQYYFSKGQLSKARHLYDTIIDIDKDAPSFEPTMHSYEGLGNIEMNEKNFRQATEYYRLALAYALKQGLSINARNFYTKLGSSLLADHRYDSALHYLQLAIAQSLKSKDYYNLTAAYNDLSLVYQKQNKYPEALEALRMHGSFYDSILNIEKIRSVNNLEVLYRTRQKESEILRLQAVEQEKNFAIRKRNVSIALGIGIVIVMAVILILLRRAYKHKQKLQEENVKKLERQHQVASLQSMINGQEAERSRMARDLHDGLGGLFSTVKMYFSTLEHDHSDLKTNNLFKKSYSLVDSASVEIRRIAHNMMPDVLTKMGLVNAIKDLTDNINAGRLLSVSLEVHGMDERLNSSTEIMLFRIIQELLNNIIKHAGASEVIIQLIKDGNRLNVVVEDNGCGFNTLHTDGANHAGIETIKSRVSYLNGTITIDSQKNIGTSVMMDFIIEQKMKV
jgi:two-component system, NarL family, sensor kinase